MSIEVVLAWLSPLLLFILVMGVVSVVALTQAAEADVPAVMEKCAIILRELCQRLPGVHFASDDDEDADRQGEETEGTK